MKFALRDIKPNPFRNVERYPINREKIDALKESLRSTGFWNNVVARKINGSPELAYGHHRHVALKEEFGDDYEIDLIIRDLDNEAMLKIMARENMEEWSSSASVLQETVRATVEAFAEGKIRLDPPDDTNKNARTERIAPSFISTKFERAAVTARNPLAYTNQTLGEFLGWLTASGGPQRRVRESLAALSVIEQKLCTEADFLKLGPKAAETIVKQINASLKRHEGDDEKTATRAAKKVGKAVSMAMRDDKALSTAAVIAKKVDPAPKQLEDIEKVVEKFCAKLAKILSDSADVTKELREIIKSKEYLSGPGRGELAMVLDGIAERASDYARQIKPTGDLANANLHTRIGVNS